MSPAPIVWGRGFARPISPLVTSGESRPKRGFTCSLRASFTFAATPNSAAPWRIAPEKGLHVLAESFIHLRRDTEFRGALDLAGYLAPEHRSEEHTSELQSPCNLVC